MKSTSPTPNTSPLRNINVPILGNNILEKVLEIINDNQEIRALWKVINVNAIDRLGMKFAEHSGGSPVNDPSQLDRGLDAAEWERTAAFIERSFRFGRTRLSHHSACMYTRSPDEHFLIDLHPAHRQIAFVAGLSGHGFKFAPVIGQQLVDLLAGQPHPDFEFLRLARIRKQN